MQWKTEKFIEAFETIRKKQGLTKAAAGRKIGVRDPVNAWKARKGPLKLETLITICNVFGVSLDYLVTGEEPQPGDVDVKNLRLEYMEKIGALQDHIITLQREVAELKKANAESTRKNRAAS